MQRRELHAMGTTVELLVDAPPGGATERAFDQACAEIERLEGRLSRFRPDSELSELNRRGRLAGGEDLLAVVALAIEARERTGGRFDPTVHDAVVAAGYDRTFEEIPADGPEPPGGSPACGGEVAVDAARGEVVLGPGVRLDLGGIAKGYVVDRVAERLGASGPCLVNAGGDLRIAGPLRSEAWPVGVETPGGPLVLGLRGGAAATSGRNRRRGRRGGREQHHLIDPARGRPARGDLRTVTVVAGEASRAEILAKALFLRGEQGAREEADRHGVPAVLVTADGRVLLAGGLS
jgi:thiamine biosynthesis lipoprotein